MGPRLDDTGERPLNAGVTGLVARLSRTVTQVPERYVEGNWRYEW
jgi:hypothetical protein